MIELSRRKVLRGAVGDAMGVGMAPLVGPRAARAGAAPAGMLLTSLRGSLGV